MDTENFKINTPIQTLGEFGLIEHLAQKIEIHQKSTIKGIGDDAAVLQMPANMLTVVSTDLLLEGIHFDLMYVPLKHLGYKAVAVNLSDIYAMNAQPTQITVSVGVDKRFSVQMLDELYAGIRAACRAYEVDIVGGDTCSSLTGFTISITAIGVVNANRIVYRNGAKAGEVICVTGDLGAAYVGLQLLEREKRLFLENPAMQPNLEEQAYVVGRQLKPEPRRDIIDVLQKCDIIPTAMIDVSDGLSSDLLHICKQSGVGCRLFEQNIPLHQDTVAMAQKFNINPLTCALNGGEDYELLFTVPIQHVATLQNMHGIALIGRITHAHEGCKLFTSANNQYDLVAQGWKHL